MNAASPRIGVSYDAGNTPIASVAMDRWVSMATYTGSTPNFLSGTHTDPALVVSAPALVADPYVVVSGLATGMKTCGSKFGVGLCPICGQVMLVLLLLVLLIVLLMLLLVLLLVLMLAHVLTHSPRGHQISVAAVKVRFDAIGKYAKSATPVHKRIYALELCCSFRK